MSKWNPLNWIYKSNEEKLEEKVEEKPILDSKKDDNELVEAQKVIFKIEKEIEMNIKSLSKGKNSQDQDEYNDLIKKLEKLEGEHSIAQKDLSQRQDGLNKANTRVASKLAELLSKATPTESERKQSIERTITTLENGLSKGLDRLKEHKEFVSSYKEQEKENLIAKDLQKQKNYEVRKKDFFDLVDTLASNPEQYKDILTPYSQKNGQDLGWFDKAKLAANVGIFGIRNMGILWKVKDSLDFYKKALKKTANVDRDINKSGFFIKLLDDTEAIEFIKNKGQNVEKLINNLSPAIMTFLNDRFKDSSVFEQDLSEKQKKYGDLLNLERNLAEYEKKDEGSLADNELGEKQILTRGEKQILTRKVEKLQAIRNNMNYSNILNTLNEKGMGQSFIEAEIMPYAAKSVNALMQDLDEFRNVSIAAAEYFNYQYIRNDTWNSLYSIDIEKFLNNSQLNKLLVENTNFFITISDIIAEQEPLKNYLKTNNITKEAYKERNNHFYELACSFLEDTHEIGNLYKGFLDYSKNDGLKLYEKIFNALANPELKKSLENYIPTKILKNKEHLKEISKYYLDNNEWIKSSMKQYDISKEILDSTLDVTINLSRDLLPLFSKIASTQDEKSKNLFLNIAQYQKMTEPEAKDRMLIIAEAFYLMPQLIENGFPAIIEKNSEKISQVVKKIIQETELISNDPWDLLYSIDIEKFLNNSQLSKLLVKNTDFFITISNIGAEQEPLKNYLTTNNITKDAYKKYSNHFYKLAGSFLEDTHEIGNLYKSFIDYSKDDSLKLYEKIFNALANPELKESFEKYIPKKILENKEHLKEVSKYPLDNNKWIKSAMEQYGISKEVLDSTLDVTIDLSKDLLPLFSKIASTIKQDKKSKNLFLNIAQYQEMTEPKAKDRMLSAIITEAFDLKGSNTELKGLIENNFPAIIEKNSKEISQAVDKIIQKTKLTTFFKLNMNSLVINLAKETPKIFSIYQEYSKGSKFKAGVKAIKLLVTNKTLFQSVVKMVLNWGLGGLKKTKDRSKAELVVIKKESAKKQQDNANKKDSQKKSKPSIGRARAKRNSPGR